MQFLAGSPETLLLEPGALRVLPSVRSPSLLTRFPMLNDGQAEGKLLKMPLREDAEYLILVVTSQVKYLSGLINRTSH